MDETTGENTHNLMDLSGCSMGIANMTMASENSGGFKLTIASREPIKRHTVWKESLHYGFFVPHNRRDISIQPPLSLSGTCPVWKGLQHRV